MKKKYTNPEFELFVFKLSDKLLTDGDDIAYYNDSIRASGETPIPGYNEDIEIDF